MSEMTLVLLCKASKRAIRKSAMRAFSQRVDSQCSDAALVDRFIDVHSRLHQLTTRLAESAANSRRPAGVAATLRTSQKEANKGAAAEKFEFKSGVGRSFRGCDATRHNAKCDAR